MSNKQFFAQITVFGMLGLNVAAYYFLWPNSGGTSGDVIPFPQEETESRPVPKKSPPREIDVRGVSSPRPGSPDSPASSTTADKSSEAADPVKQLLQEIRKQTPGTSPPAALPQFSGKPETFPATPEKGTSNPPIPMPMEVPVKPNDRVTPQFTEPAGTPDKNKANPPAPKELPPLKAEPLRVPGPGDNKKSPPSEGLLPVTLPSNPDSKQQSPWLLNMEVVGAQARLIVQLRQPPSTQPLAEFRILCDRVEMQAPHALRAIGKVTFAGAGLKGNCQRLTLPFNEMRIIFEESVEIARDSAVPAASELDAKKAIPDLGSLRGESIIWELPASALAATTKTQEATPATFNQFAPPPALDLPNSKK